MENRMAGEIQAAFDAVYADGPATNPIEPLKSDIRSRVGGTIQAEFDDLEQTFTDAIEDITDLIATGSKQVDPVVFRTTASGSMATVFAAGTVHDGVTAVASQRFFIDGRGAENGIYNVTTGTPTRTTDADQGSELPGITFLVQLGTADSGKTFVCTTPGPVTLGTTSLTFKQSGQPSSAVIPTLSAGTPATTPDGRDFVMINGSTLFRYTWEKLLARIREDSMPTEYTFNSSDVVGTSVKTVLYSDPKQTRAFFQNLGTTGEIALVGGGKTPVLHSVGYTLGPGAGIEIKLPPGDVKMIGSQSGIPYACDYSNLSNVDPNAFAAADAHVARYSATLTTPMRTAIRNLYASLAAASVFSRNGRIAVWSAPNTADSLLKWGRSGSYTRLGTPTANWTGMTFDGVDDAVDIGELLTSFASGLDHTYMYYVDDSIQGSTRFAGGDSSVRVGPNRTSTGATMLSLSSAQVVTVDGTGGLQGVTRTSAGKFTAHRDIGSTHFEQEITVTDTSTSTSIPVDGGIRGTGGVSSYYQGVIKFRYIGLSLTQAQRYAVASALETYFAATAGF
jgi:hypothetical protein